VDGVTPLLLLFAKRLDYDIVSCKRIVVDSTGNFREASSGEKARGLRMELSGHQKKAKTLFYFSLNAADAGIKRNPEFVAFMRHIPTCITYLKGASYLMHKGTFSRIRNMILEKSVQVVQDDSGIGFNYFLRQKEKWSFTLFGEYSKPISMFAGRYQPSLDSLFKLQGSTDLHFGIGYNYRDKNSNLMIATKRKVG
jgi:hypothetical protein